MVDDERKIAQAIRVRLQAAGFKVLAAYDGAQGVETATREKPDAIVLDIRMPVMDGLTALTKLRENEATRHIPVVILSASLVKNREAIDRGARYFLEKPYEAQRLLDTLQTVLQETSHCRS